MHTLITKHRNTKPYMVEAVFGAEYDREFIGRYHTLYMALRAAARPLRIMEEFVYPKEIVLRLHIDIRGMK